MSEETRTLDVEADDLIEVIENLAEEMKHRYVEKYSLHGSMYKWDPTKFTEALGKSVTQFVVAMCEKDLAGLYIEAADILNCVAAVIKLVDT